MVAMGAPRPWVWSVLQPLLSLLHYSTGCVPPCARNFQCAPGRCTEHASLGAQQKLRWTRLFLPPPLPLPLSDWLCCSTSWSWEVDLEGWTKAAVDYSFSTLDESLIGVAFVESRSQRKVLDKMKKNKVSPSPSLAPSIFLVLCVSLLLSLTWANGQRRTEEDTGWLISEGRCVTLSFDLALPLALFRALCLTPSAAQL